MAGKNSVTLTFLGNARNLEETISRVDAATHRLSGRIDRIGRNGAKGGGIFALGSGLLAMAGPLGAAGLALGAFGAVATTVLKKHKQAGNGLKTAWHGIAKALTPLVLSITRFAGKVLKDAGPAITKLAKAGGQVIKGFLTPFDRLLGKPVFGQFIAQVAKFAVMAGQLVGGQLTKLLAILMKLFIQIMPSGMKILNILLPLFVNLVSNLTPVIAVVAKIISVVIQWLNKTHLLIPLLAILAVAILAIEAPVGAVVAAVAVLIAIGVMLAKHWHTIWGTIKNIISDVWDWIKSHWPLLLAILTGPIGLAVLFIVKHWDQIKQAGMDVWNWIKSLPGKIGSVFALVGKAISAPFLLAFNLIRSAWNSTIGGKGFTIPSWVPGIGGDSFRIPTFHTGGIVGGTGEKLAMVKGGEGVFTPEQMAAMGGSGNVVIQVRGGGSGLDALFMRWLKENVRINGGDPAMFQRKVAFA